MSIDVSGLTIIAEADATPESDGAWSGATATPDVDVYREATASIGSIQRSTTAPRVTTGSYWAKAASPWINLTNNILYIWMNHTAVKALDTKASGGIRIYLRDSSDREAQWFVDGKETYPGGWKCYALDCDTTPSVVTAGFAIGSIRGIGMRFKHTENAANVRNTWIDVIRRADKTSGGITIYGGTVESPSKFSEIVTDEMSIDDKKAYGIIRPEGGALLLRGRVRIGMTEGVTETYFKDTSQVIVFEEATYYLPDTGLVPMLSTACNEILFQGVSSVYPTKAYLGDSSGSGADKVGISGCFLKAAGAAKFTIVATSENVTHLGLYGCSFVNAHTISLPPYSVNKDVLNCNFEACAEILADTCIIKKCNFISSVGRAIKISSTSHKVTECNFINCQTAIHHNVGGAVESPAHYDYDKLMFTGGTHHIENSASAPNYYIDIDRLNGSNPDQAKINNSNGGTTIILAIGVILTLIGLLTGSEVRIYEAGTITELAGTESAGSEGEFDFSYNYVANTYVDIVVHHLNRLYYRLKNYLLGLNNASLPIVQQIDRQYHNP